MKLWKNTIALRLPLWGIGAVVLALLILIGVFILNQTNCRENLLLRTLDTDKISAAYICNSEGMTVQRNELSREDIVAMTEVINKICLLGKPYEFDAIGGSPCTYEITLNNGDALRVGCQLVGDSYYYWLNESYYYICATNDQVDLTVFAQLEALHRQQSEVYFR